MRRTPIRCARCRRFTTWWTTPFAKQLARRSIATATSSSSNSRMDSCPLTIEAAGLGRDYGSTCALDALDLSVSPGANVGLLGPNGAGKTTTMLLLATLLKPSRGAARVFGYDVTHQRAAIRR